jgi:hypothetical protein
MLVGVMIPQGWKYEYNGWDAAAAWARTLELARDAEALGFESEWVFDHFHTVPEPLDEITFESFTTLTAGDPPSSVRRHLISSRHRVGRRTALRADRDARGS